MFLYHKSMTKEQLLLMLSGADYMGLPVYFQDQNEDFYQVVDSGLNLTICEHEDMEGADIHNPCGEDCEGFTIMVKKL